MSLFEVAAEHARGFGFIGGIVLNQLWCQGAGRHCHTINTTVCNPHYLYTIAVVIQRLMPTMETSKFKLHHESPVLLGTGGGDKK